MVRQFGSWQP